MKRSTSLATLGGAAFLVAASMTLGSQAAVAADHSDGDAVGSNAAADIADLYAWTSSGSDILTLIMTVPGPVSADVQYVFHVGRQDTALNAATAWAGAGETTDIICVTSGGGTDTQCWVGDPAAGGDYVSGDATPDAGITSDSGDVRVHVNTHADPFFFFAGGFTTAITAVNTVAGGLGVDANNYPQNADDAGQAVAVFGPGCDGNGASSPADALVRMLDGTFAWANTTDGCSAGTSVNGFEGSNVDAIVVEVDTSLLAGTDTNAFLQVWASTHDGA